MVPAFLARSCAVFRGFDEERRTFLSVRVCLGLRVCAQEGEDVSGNWRSRKPGDGARKEKWEMWTDSFLFVTLFFTGIEFKRQLDTHVYLIGFAFKLLTLSIREIEFSRRDELHNG